MKKLLIVLLCLPVLLNAQILTSSSFETAFPTYHNITGADYFPFRDLESRTTYGLSSDLTRARSGTRSFRVETRSTDPEAQHGKIRAEMVLTLNTGTQWYAVSTYQPSATWQYSTLDEIFPWQWHDKSTRCSASPPLGFEVFKGRHRVMIRYSTADYCVASNRKIVASNGLDIGPVLYDQWVDWVLQYLPRTDGTGRVKIWKNGVVVLDYTGPCHYVGSDFPYMKLGVYNFRWNGTLVSPSVRIGYIDMFRSGGANSTYESMSLTGPVPVINLAPTITMPANQSLPGGTTSTSITADDADADGTVVTRQWLKVSGPGTQTLTNSGTKTLGVTGLLTGQYIFSYKVTDNQGATATKTISVNVDAVNVAPTANAGTNVTRPPGSTTASLTGAGSTDPDGTITAYLWTKVSGNGGTIVTPNAVNTNLTGLTPGTNYVYQLRVTDNDGAQSIATVGVSIQPQAAPPVVTPVQPVVVTRSTTNTTGVSVNATSAGSTIPSNGYAWTQLEGPNTSVITSGTTDNPTVSGLIIGTYTYQVVVTDAQGLTSTATVSVRVNKPPTVDLDANTDFSFIIGVVSVPVVSVPDDDDGTIASGVWTVVQGTGTFTNASLDNTVFTAAGPGEYILRRTVTDNDGEEGSKDYAFVIQAGYLKSSHGTRKVLITQ